MPDKKNPYAALFGLGRELGLTPEDTKELIYRETDTTSLKQLTPGQIKDMKQYLGAMKDRARRQKRTDEGGSLATEQQRRLVHILTGQLGWNNDNKRINGFVRKYFGIDRLEWLSAPQCQKLIEMLKCMVREKEKKEKDSTG